MNGNYDWIKDLPPTLSQKDMQQILELLSCSQKARQTLIERNLRLVVHVAKKFTNQGIYDLEDLYSVGTIGLIKAVDTFSIDAGSKFCVYAYSCIKNEILMYLRANKKHVGVVSLDSSICNASSGEVFTLKDLIFDSCSDSAFLSAINREMISYVLTLALNNLTTRQSIILFYKLGGKTQQEIATMFGLSKTYICRLEKAIHSKLIDLMQKNSASTQGTQKSKDFIFKVIDEQFFNIGFSTRKFKNFDGDYFWVQLPNATDSFILIADMLKSLL